MKRKILVVEDDLSICDLICIHLIKNDFDYHVVHTGEDALAQLEVYTPDFIILDWMIPNLSGLEVLKRIKNRSRFKKIPVLMLTARNSEQDKVVSFENGLDDYITKPFLPSELIARVKAILNRTQTSIDNSDFISYGDLSVDNLQKKAFRGKRKLKLGPTEFGILIFLLKNEKRVFSREQILNKIWPDQINVELRTVDVHIRRLRKELNSNGERDLIRTVRSAGYSIDFEN